MFVFALDGCLEEDFLRRDRRGDSSELLSESLPDDEDEEEEEEEEEDDDDDDDDSLEAVGVAESISKMLSRARPFFIACMRAFARCAESTVGFTAMRSSCRSSASTSPLERRLLIKPPAPPPKFRPRQSRIAPTGVPSTFVPPLNLRWRPTYSGAYAAGRRSCNSSTWPSSRCVFSDPTTLPPLRVYLAMTRPLQPRVIIPSHTHTHAHTQPHGNNFAETKHKKDQQNLFL